MKRLSPTRYSKPATLFLMVLVCCALSGCDNINVTDLKMLATPSLENCWPCSMYKIVFDAIAATVKTTYVALSDAAQLLLGVGLLFWIALKVGVMVSSLKQPNLREFITTMFATLFKGIVVAVIVSVPDYAMSVLDMIATPVLTTFIEMARTVLYSDTSITKHFTAPDTVTFADTNAPLLTGQVGYLVQDIVYRIYVALHSGMVLGFHMLLTFDSTARAMGGLVAFAFFFLMWTFPVLFIDSFVRLGAAFVLFPFLLVAWVFPSTKQYIGEAWKLLFGATMQILVACVFIAIMVTAVKSYSDSYSISRQLSDPMLMLGLKTASNEALSFLLLSMCMMKLTGKVPAVSGYFGGDATQSEMVKAFSHVGRMGAAMGKVAAGGALMAAGVGGAGIKKMFSQGQDEMKNAAFQGGTHNADWEYNGGQTRFDTNTDYDRYTGNGETDKADYLNSLK